jgi:hypothetical protein
MTQAKIAFLYEHPTWSNELLSAFARRGVELTPINVAELDFNTDVNDCTFGSAVNRINIMPSSGRSPQIVFQTLHYLSWLEIAGVRVVNGARAHFIGASKAMQNGVFSMLGLAHPGAIAIYRPEDALSAAESIGYPVIIKPNIGGSGSGVARYNSKEELHDAIRFRSLDLGVDRSGLVQQFIESDGYVYRVEILGDKLFYSIRQPINEGSRFSIRQNPSLTMSSAWFVSAVLMLEASNILSIQKPDCPVITISTRIQTSSVAENLF